MNVAIRFLTTFAFTTPPGPVIVPAGLPWILEIIITWGPSDFHSLGCIVTYPKTVFLSDLKAGRIWRRQFCTAHHRHTTCENCPCSLRGRNAAVNASHGKGQIVCFFSLHRPRD